MLSPTLKLGVPIGLATLAAGYLCSHAGLISLQVPTDAEAELREAAALRDERAPARPETTAGLPKISTLGDLQPILDCPDPLERKRRLVVWLDRLPAADFTAAFQRFSGKGLDPALFIPAWVSRDPLAAVETVQASGTHFRSLAVEAWARRDPGAALAWLQKQQQDGAIGDSDLMDAVRALTCGVASKDPALAKELTRGFDEFVVRYSGSALNESVLARGYDYALEWMKSEGIDGQLLGGLATLDGARLVRDLQERNRWEKPGDDPDEDSDETGVPDFHLTAVATGWARTDPAAALAWVKQIRQEGRKPDVAVKDLSRQLVITAPELLPAWLGEMPAGDNYDRGRYYYAFGTYADDPATAMETVLQMEPVYGRHCYNVLIEKWRALNPAAADAWIQANSARLPAGLPPWDDKNESEEEMITPDKIPTC